MNPYPYHNTDLELNFNLRPAVVLTHIYAKSRYNSIGSKDTVETDGHTDCSRLVADNSCAGRGAGGVAVDAHVDSVCGPVVPETVAVDELALRAVEQSCVVDRHQNIVVEAATAKRQPLTVAASRQPQPLVDAAAAQRVDVD